MSRILHLDASARDESSFSRQLSRFFIESWLKHHPDDEVIYRDVGRLPPPHVTESSVQGVYAPPSQHSPEAKAALAVSDALIDEFLSAERYVFGIPMYNFHVPSTFKAYVDQIVRIGRTFDEGWKGLVQGKKMLVITARGGNYEPGSRTHASDHQEPWIRTIFGFIGIADISFIHAQGVVMGDQALQPARKRIEELVQTW
ncbi:MAG: FMN-dependent NADH-azoreductase [Thermoguttaceae bacterium]